MAALFGRETPVLWYGPRAPDNPGKRNQRRYLFWPAWAYRVMAPQERDRRFNRLQMAVLGILTASRLTAQELGHRLGIDPVLVDRVISELQGNGSLDLSRQVTLQGRKDLDAEREEAAQLIPAWVFRDPWNEKLWPFIARQLKPAPTMINDQGFLQLQLGTTGLPWYQPVFMQRQLPETMPKAPDAREIIRAANDQRKIKSSENLMFWQESHGGDFHLRGVDLKRICQIEEEAYPVFLTTFLYIPQDGPESGLDWQVCDFFGRGNDSKFKQQLARVAKDYPPLAQQLDQVIGRTRLYEGQGNDHFLEQEEQRRARAHIVLVEALTLEIRGHEALFAVLTEMLEAWFEVKALGEQASQRRQKHVLIIIRQVLETLFGELAKQFPLRGLWKTLPDDREKKLRETLFWQTAISVGFTDFPQAWVHVKKNNLQWVCDQTGSNISKLQPLVVATLLCASKHQEHPLRSAAIAFPDFLEKIAQVIDLGGAGAHAGETAVVLSDVQSGVKQTLCIVGSLLSLSMRPLEEIEING